MGALPKNKITRVERGKRRAGNSPKLKKDLNSLTPFHKRGFVAEFLRFAGLTSQKDVAQTPKKVESKKATAATVANQASKAKSAVRQATQANIAKATRKTQHKG